MKGFSAPSEGIYSLWCRLPLLWPQGHPWSPFQVTKQCSTHKSSVRRVLSDQRPSFIRHLWYPQPTGQAETAGRKASEKGNLYVCEGVSQSHIQEEPQLVLEFQPRTPTLNLKEKQKAGLLSETFLWRYKWLCSKSPWAYLSPKEHRLVSAKIFSIYLLKILHPFLVFWDSRFNPGWSQIPVLASQIKDWRWAWTYHPTPTLLPLFKVWF